MGKGTFCGYWLEITSFLLGAVFQWVEFLKEFNSEKTSQNSPNQRSIEGRFGTFVQGVPGWPLDTLQRGVLGGLKQEERKEWEQRSNCHGRPHCTYCKSKKSGFRLKSRIKKLSPRIIWQKSQKGISYLWLNWNLETVHLDWLQVFPNGFEKGTLLKSTFEKKWYSGLKSRFLQYYW